MQAVQAQDYPNLVHAVLDNASTDTTPEIIARYQMPGFPCEFREMHIPCRYMRTGTRPSH